MDFNQNKSGKVVLGGVDRRGGLIFGLVGFGKSSWVQVWNGMVIYD